MGLFDAFKPTPPKEFQVKETPIPVPPQQIQQPPSPETNTLAQDIVAAIELLNERILICNENQLHISNQVQKLNDYMEKLPLVPKSNQDETKEKDKK